MTTQELVERLRTRTDRVKYEGSLGYYSAADAETDRAAASRLSEMEGENKRLREALADLTSWFTDLPLVHNVWIIPAGERGADAAVNAARAALEHQQKETP